MVFSSALILVPFFAIMMFDVVCHFRQRIFDRLNEIPTTGSHSAEANHRVTLGPIIRYCQHLAVRAETMCGPLDKVISSLAAA